VPFLFVEPEVYEKYKEEVLALSQAIQINYPEHMPADKRRPGLTDKQIAERLGLDERTVVEIRCVAEREYYPIDEWEKAREFKDRVCRGYAEQGLAFVTKKYIRKD
jgi:putative NIF3 family GTP cyclohydrolase 1 type 2